MNADRKRDLLEVSCKCAIFTPDGSRVLLADYGKESYGLPGGHVDIGESPDETMKRELQEELGITITAKRADFFLHPNGKIVLGYVAIADESETLTVQQDEISGAVWEDVAAIRDGRVLVSSYKDFILGNVI